MRMGSASSPPASRTRSRRPTSSAASSAQAGECPHRASTSSATGTAPASRDGPLFLLLDVAALEREEPALLRRLLRAEDEALGDPRLRACAAYAVFPKRR